MKPGSTVKIIDSTSSYFGQEGTVVSLATTSQLEVVSVRLPSAEHAQWFRRDQVAAK